jgi:hypothetical protein
MTIITTTSRIPITREKKTVLGNGWKKSESEGGACCATTPGKKTRKTEILAEFLAGSSKSFSNVMR